MMLRNVFKEGIGRVHCSLSTVSKLTLQQAEQRLINAGVPDAEQSVRILHEFVKGDEVAFEKVMTRRIKREPLQYIIGEWDFHDITLSMSLPVLIPRPETEELVEFVLAHIPKDSTSQINILDIGTGTGAIALALAHARKNVMCSAIDIDPRSCDIAFVNTRRNELCNRVTVAHASFENYSFRTPFDIIVSNPPYIPTSELSTLQTEVRLFESSTALDGGSADGGEIPRRVISKSAGALKPGGKLFLELHHTHTSSIVASWLAELHSPLKLVQSRKDFAGIERFHCIQKQD